MHLPSTALNATVKAIVVVAFWRHSGNRIRDSLIVAGKMFESMVSIPTVVCGINTFI